MSWRNKGPISRLSGSDGFTLIEVLVAFVVLSLLLSVLLRAVVGLRDDAVTVDVRTHSEMVARAQLEDALSNRTLRNGTYSGTRDGTRWTLVASFVDLAAQLPPPKPVDTPQTQPGAPPGQQPQQDQGPPPWRTQRLVVRADTSRRPIEVETIRLIRVEP